MTTDRDDIKEPTREQLEQLQRDAGIPHLPTVETYWHRKAMSGEGPHAFEWTDKPHRLVFDLCRIIEASAASPPSPAPAESGAVAESSRQIIHELAADIRDRLSKEEGSANWRNAQRIVELSRPAAPSASMGRVTVKALEWGERRTNTAGDWTWGAKTSIGWYIASTASGERCKGSHFWFIVGETISAWANSEDEAKAAAQADYEARVLSALDYHEPAPDDTQPALPSTAETKAPPEHGGGEGWPNVDDLAQIIRRVDGANMLGAGELAERILKALAALRSQP